MDLDVNLPLDMAANLVLQTKNDIKKGSKSFALASFFFSQKEKEAAWKLYSWCRYCDDMIDTAVDLKSAQQQVELLIQYTKACYEKKGPLEHPWPAFSDVIHTYSIPQKYPLDLLRGFKLDSVGANINTREQLLDYCYCVAGTVGLMMCHIMKTSSQLALKNAVDLGRAMQLTNIARDISEDFSNHRVYLPKAWLADCGLTNTNFLDDENKTKFHSVVRQLIDEAQAFYKSGFSGLKYLSLRSAWAVCIATYVYRDIGDKILKNYSWEKRIYVSTPRKIYLLILASFRLVPLILYRFVKPWKSSTHLEIWSEK